MKRFTQTAPIRFALVAALALAGLAASAHCNKGGSGGAKKKAAEKIGNLSFHRDVKAAFALAKKSGKPIFLDFYADWCVNCKLFNKLAVRDKTLNAALQKAVLVKIYDTDAAFREYAKKPYFQELNSGLPFFVVLSPDGKPRWKTQDYRNVAGMVKALGAAVP